jgi:hypothetical protein
MREMHELLFTVLAWGIIALITIAAIPLERYVNQLTNRVLDRKKDSRQPSVVGYQPKLETKS